MVEISFSWSKDDKAINVLEIFTRFTIARKGFDPKYILGSCMADGYSQKVAVLASVEVRV